MAPKDQPTVPQDADFAGKIETTVDHLRPKSWHWIKSNINIDILIKNFRLFRIQQDKIL